MIRENETNSKPIVQVVFRMSKNPYTKEDECVAFFINLPAKYGYISMYSHIGQHDEASLEYYQSTKKASPEQYKELYKELQSVYDDCTLEIKQSMNYNTLRMQWNNSSTTENVRHCSATRNIVKENTNNGTDNLTQTEINFIRKIFNRNDVDIVSEENTQVTYDGVIYNEYLISTDNMNAMQLGNLEDDLRELEDRFDIGYESDSNENGFYAKDFYFYHYAD